MGLLKRPFSNRLAASLILLLVTTDYVFGNAEPRRDDDWYHNQFRISRHGIDVDEIKETANFDDEGTASIPLDDFLRLRAAASTSPSPTPSATPAPQPFIIRATSVNGTLASPHLASLDVEFQVTILRKGWIQVPLIDTRHVISGWDIWYKNEKLDAGSADAARLNLVDGAYGLLAQQEGDYKIVMQALVAVTTTNKIQSASSLSLVLPSGQQSLRNELSFVLPLPDVYVTVSPSVYTSSGRKPGDPSNEASGIKETKIHTFFSPTDKLCIDWVPQEESSDDMASPTSTPTTLRSHQIIHHDITNDLYLITTTTFDYSISFGKQTKFQIELDPRVRILDVEGDVSITRWDVTPPPKEQEKDGEAGRWLLNVYLEHPVDNNFQLRVVSEMELGLNLNKGINMADVVLPTFTTVGVRRETCVVGVSAGSFLQVNEKKRDTALTRTDVRDFEMESHISLPASHPLVWAYSSTSADYLLTISVTKHNDVGVLPAIVENARYELTVVDDRVLYYMTYQIRNSQKQYLRVDVPNKNYQVWSTYLANEPVKPSSDANAGALLIPLRKDLGDDQSSTYEIQLVYFAPMSQALDLTGNITLPLPRIDVPITTLQVHTYLPVNYSYSFQSYEVSVDASTDPSKAARPRTAAPMEERLREVPCHTLRQSNNGRADNAMGGGGGAVPRAQFMAAPPQKFAFEEAADVAWEEGVGAQHRSFGNNQREMFRGQHKKAQATSGGFYAYSPAELEGVVPVRISPLHVGQQRCFSQLLVRDNAFATLHATYEHISAKPITWWQRIKTAITGLLHTAAIEGLFLALFSLVAIGSLLFCCRRRTSGASNPVRKDM